MIDESTKIFFGVIVSMLASLMDALGLNVQRRDHILAAQAAKPRHECLRFNWHLGLYLYCSSQIVGSTLALQLLKAQWAAPLGAISLIFNFVFARFLVGTHITARDIIGTFIILVAILIIVLFGAFFGPADDVESQLSVEVLKALFQPAHFKFYFSILNIAVVISFASCVFLKWVLEEEGRLERYSFLSRFNPDNLARSVGIAISAVGGTLAAETLLLAKSGVQLIVLSFNDPTQLQDIMTVMIIIALGLSCLLQIYCLNAGLKLADSVVVVPIFACTYNVFGLANSMVYLNLFGLYPWWVHLTSVIGIIILVFGIVILANQEKLPPQKIPKLKPKLPQLNTLSKLTIPAPQWSPKGSVDSLFDSMRSKSSRSNTSNRSEASSISGMGPSIQLATTYANPPIHPSPLGVSTALPTDSKDSKNI